MNGICEGCNSPEGNCQCHLPEFALADTEDARMRRFWLFGGLVSEPRGGMRDFCGSFDSEEQAISVAEQGSDHTGPFECWHVFDFEELVITAASDIQTDDGDFPELWL